MPAPPGCRGEGRTPSGVVGAACPGDQWLPERDHQAACGGPERGSWGEMDTPSHPPWCLPEGRWVLWGTVKWGVDGGSPCPSLLYLMVHRRSRGPALCAAPSQPFTVKEELILAFAFSHFRFLPQPWPSGFRTAWPRAGFEKCGLISYRVSKRCVCGHLFQKSPGLSSKIDVLTQPAAWLGG